MYTVNLGSIRCNREVNEGSASEEPYVLVTSVKLTPTGVGLALPSFEVFRYGVWEDTDAGETKTNTGLPFWGNPAPDDIPSPDSVIFIVSLMENDNGNPDTYRTLVKGAAATSLASTVGQPRATQVTTLINDIRDTLNGIDLPIPLALDDDHVASVELRLNPADLAPTPAPVRRSVDIRNREGNYTLNFTIWNHSTAFAGTRISATDASDVGVGLDSRIWIVRRDGTIRFSTDAGARFNRVEASGFANLAVGADNSVWAVGSNGTLWNLNRGAWTRLPATGMNDVSVARDGRIWLAGTNGTIWFSNDRGLDYRQIDASGFARVAADPDGTLWAVGSNGTLWHFNRASWTQTGAVGIRDVAVAPDGRIWVAGTNGTIWYSRDRGVNFTQIEASRFARVAVGPDGVLWAVATDGSLWKFTR